MTWMPPGWKPEPSLLLQTCKWMLQKDKDWNALLWKKFYPSWLQAPQVFQPEEPSLYKQKSKRLYFLPCRRPSTIPRMEMKQQLQPSRVYELFWTGYGSAIQTTWSRQQMFWRTGVEIVSLVKFSAQHIDWQGLESRRLPYGQAGILNFFLRLIASSEVTDNNLLLHSLRLTGNSCADTGKWLCFIDS